MNIPVTYQKIVTVANLGQDFTLDVDERQVLLNIDPLVFTRNGSGQVSLVETQFTTLAELQLSEVIYPVGRAIHVVGVGDFQIAESGGYLQTAGGQHLLALANSSNRLNAAMFYSGYGTTGVDHTAHLNAAAARAIALGAILKLPATNTGAEFAGTLVFNCAVEGSGVDNTKFDLVATAGEATVVFKRYSDWHSLNIVVDPTLARFEYDETVLEVTTTYPGKLVTLGQDADRFYIVERSRMYNCRIANHSGTGIGIHAQSSSMADSVNGLNLHFICVNFEIGLNAYTDGTGYLNGWVVHATFYGCLTNIYMLNEGSQGINTWIITGLWQYSLGNLKGAVIAGQRHKVVVDAYDYPENFNLVSYQSDGIRNTISLGSFSNAVRDPKAGSSGNILLSEHGFGQPSQPCIVTSANGVGLTANLGDNALTILDTDTFVFSTAPSMGAANSLIGRSTNALLTFTDLPAGDHTITIPVGESAIAMIFMAAFFAEDKAPDEVKFEASNDGGSTWFTVKPSAASAAYKFFDTAECIVATVDPVSGRNFDTLRITMTNLATKTVVLRKVMSDWSTSLNGAWLSTRGGSVRGDVTLLEGVVKITSADASEAIKIGVTNAGYLSFAGDDGFAGLWRDGAAWMTARALYLTQASSKISILMNESASIGRLTFASSSGDVQDVELDELGLKMRDGTNVMRTVLDTGVATVSATVGSITKYSFDDVPIEVQDGTNGVTLAIDGSTLAIATSVGAVDNITLNGVTLKRHAQLAAIAAPAAGANEDPEVRAWIAALIAALQGNDFMAT